MTAEQQFKVRYYSRAFVFASVITAFLCTSWLFAAQQSGERPTAEPTSADTGPARYRVFTPRHISGRQAIALLDELGIGTASKLPRANAILVTAQARELIKVAVILKLIDAEEEFAIKRIYPAPADGNLPSTSTVIASSDRIAAELGGDISIGTFSQPPDENAKSKAIIDIHKDAVVVIAQKDRLEEIISAVKRAGTLQKDVKPGPPLKKNESPVLAEPNEPAIPTQMAEGQDPNQTSESRHRPIAETEPVKPDVPDQTQAQPDQLFDRLIDSLAQVEKDAADSRQKVLEPNEPTPARVAAAKPKVQPQPQPELEPEPQPKPQAELEPEPPLEPEPEKPSEPIQLADEPAEPPLKVSYQPEPIIDGNEMLDLDLPEQLEIGELLRLVGEYLQLDYMYDPAKVKGAVTLKLRGPIKVKDLYPLLESVLKFRGFVMTRKVDLVTIVPVTEVLDIDPVLLDADKGQVEVGDIIVTRVFKLNYVDTGSASNLLVGMKLGVNITPIEATGTLIVSGYAYRMTRIEKLLAMIDKPGEPRQFRFKQLKYTMAETLAAKIKTLVEQMGTISITVAKPAAAPAAAAPSRGRTPPRTPRKPTPSKPADPTAKPTVYLDADERTNRILMIGLKKELAVVDELIDTLDIAQQDLRTLRLYDIQHVGAEEVQEKLTELGITGAAPTTSRSSRIRRRPTSEKPATPTPAATTESPLEGQPQVVVIEATNSLLVNATAEQHLRIATIISYVDSETLVETIPYKIYSLENQDPVLLAEVLNKLIQETTQDKEGKIESTTRRTEDEIVIVPDENTFSIIVYASQKNQKWIANLITNLDRRRPQVLIDVTLVEISESDAFAYDLQMVTKFPMLEPGGQMVGVGESAIISPFPSERRFTEVTSILGDGNFGRGFYADRHIQALLQLMQKKGYGRVLAKPKLLVNDNETGHIDTKNTLYVARVSQTGRASGSGTGDDFFSKSYTFDSFDSGIDLDITPHISEGDLLRLEIIMSRSSQPVPEGGIGENEPPPDKSENNIETIVTVPNESTIILGGILQLEQVKDNWKIPLIGDIPLIGGLFRKIDNNSRQSKLYIFVRADISRPSESTLPDLSRISERNRLAFEEYESEFQKFQDWPGIDPEPMDPLRVLESK